MRLEPLHAIACRRSTLLAVVASLACLSVGCRSGSERDLVARELRMQEDQLYAMEEYLAQYQGLLRQARAENRQLKRQISKQQGELPAPPSRSSKSATPGEAAPAAQPIDVPPVELTPVEPESREPTAPSSPGGIESPDIPTLDETTLITPEPDQSPANADIVTNEYPDEGRVALADFSSDVADANPRSGDATYATDDSGAVFEQDASSPQSADPPTQVWMHGEIIAGASDTGPRLIVDVEPLTRAGRATPFAGKLSLMILAATPNEHPTSLARWDFSPDELMEIADNPDDGEALRFYLEFPGDVPGDQALQLWVRLIGDEGEKILTHADINLAESGSFSSTLGISPAGTPAKQIVSRDQAMVQSDLANPRHALVPVDINDGTWTVAQPGRTSSSARHDHQASANWRTATQPSPVFAAESKSKPTSTRNQSSARQVEQAAYLDEPSTIPPRKFALPTWSPNR